MKSVEDIIRSFVSYMKENEEIDTMEDVPVMVGTLNKAQGIKYFEKAEIGHPVFETKDRYIVYMKSEVELKERVFDLKLGGDRTHIGFFLVAVPYYKDTLKPIIDFL